MSRQSPTHYRKARTKRLILIKTAICYKMFWRMSFNLFYITTSASPEICIRNFLKANKSWNSIKKGITSWKKRGNEALTPNDSSWQIIHGMSLSSWISQYSWNSLIVYNSDFINLCAGRLSCKYNLKYFEVIKIEVIKIERNWRKKQV